MTASWMLCLLGTITLSALMAANGSWRKYPALFVFLLLIVMQSLVCWTLWHSHAYRFAYYGFAIAEQLTELWIMVELSTQVTSASPSVERFIRRAIPTFALLTLLWCAFHAPKLPSESPRLVRIASHLDTAVSLSWTATLIAVLVLIMAAGCQFSQGARGIAIGFMLEEMASNVTAYLYVHAPDVQYLSTVKTVTYGATLLIWAVSLALPHGMHHLARMQAIPPHALDLTAAPLNGPSGKGV
jgi:hypothetical protein